MCRTWTSPLIVSTPRATEGTTLSIWVMMRTFLRSKTSATTPPKRPKRTKGRAWKAPVRPSWMGDPEMA